MFESEKSKERQKEGRKIFCGITFGIVQKKKKSGLKYKK